MSERREREREAAGESQGPAAAAVAVPRPGSPARLPRSMKLIYQEAGDYEGIPTFRFKAPDTLFANGSVYPPNEGFCPCLKNGIQNVSTCKFSACPRPDP